MWFQHQQAHDGGKDARKGQDAPPEAAHPLPRAANQRGKRENHRELCKLRGLERQSPHAEPASGAVGLDADHRHQHQKHQRKTQEGKGPAAVELHGKPGGQPHGRKTQQRKDQLPDKVIGGVAACDVARVVPGAGVAGGEDHDHPGAEQQQGQQEEGPVEGRAPTL